MKKKIQRTKCKKCKVRLNARRHRAIKLFSYLAWDNLHGPVLKFVCTVHLVVTLFKRDRRRTFSRTSQNVCINLLDLLQWHRRPIQYSYLRHVVPNQKRPPWWLPTTVLFASFDLPTHGFYISHNNLLSNATHTATRTQSKKPTRKKNFNQKKIKNKNNNFSYTHSWCFLPAAASAVGKNLMITQLLCDCVCVYFEKTNSYHTNSLFFFWRWSAICLR